MTKSRETPRAYDLDRAVTSDYHRLPDELDPTTLVETHDIDPAPTEVASKFATPDIADLARTGAIGAGF